MSAASFFRSPALPAAGALALAIALALGGAVADAQQVRTPEGIELFMENGFEYDGSTGRARIRGLRLSQGDVRIEADEGTASQLEFEASEWELKGNVRATVGTARLVADQARFAFRDDQLTMLELRGDPATFEDLDPDRSQQASGGASLIQYDRDEGTLRLFEDAWIRIGANEIMGCDFFYDLEAASYSSGTSECGEGFLLRAIPPAEESEADEPRPGP